MRIDFPLVWTLLSSNSVFLVTTWGLASAQSTPPPGVTIPPEIPDVLQESIPKPSETSPLPSLPRTVPAPSLDIPSPPSPTDSDLSGPFPIRRIIVEGASVLQSEIAALVAEYEQRGKLSFDELLELRSRITQLYITNGYVTSGAFLPNNQVLDSGEVQIQVIEGQLQETVICMLSPRSGRENSSSQDIEVAAPHQESVSSVSEDSLGENQSSGSSTEPSQARCSSAHLQESYVRSRLAGIKTQPLNQQRIEEALLLLQVNPLIQQINAELTAGSAPGQSILFVEVREAPAFRLSFGGDNYQSSSIGSEQLSIQASHDNLLGIGDRLSAGYGITQGLDSFNVGYSIPVNPQDGTLSLSYSRNESLIVETEFEDLEIRSDADTISLGFRQPVIRRPSTELALGIQTDLRHSTTFLEDQPFSFSEGPDEGRSNVTVIRLSQDWVNRNNRTVLAARSQFSFGIDAFDATINETGTDGRFFAWLGQFQWVERLSPRWVLVSRLNAQLTPDSLLSLERFGYGGVDTVRGYPQNQLVTDNGVLGSMEARFSLLSESDRLQLIPFFEAGTGWNNQSPDPNPSTIASVGLGFRWLITPDLSLQVDYGVPLVNVENRGSSLQDNGLYFSLRYQPF